MTEQPPYPSPIGFKWQKAFFGLGGWELIEDQDFPAPPPGYRYRPNFHSGKPELVRTTSDEIAAVEGITSQGSDRNTVKVPNLGPPSRAYSFAVPDPTKVGPGIQFTGPSGQDPNPDPNLRRPGSNRYNSDSTTAAIF